MSKLMHDIQVTANNSAQVGVNSPEHNLSKEERDTVLVHGREDVAAIFITNFYILKQIKTTNRLLSLILLAVLAGIFV